MTNTNTPALAQDFEIKFPEFEYNYQKRLLWTTGGSAAIALRCAGKKPRHPKRLASHKVSAL